MRVLSVVPIVVLSILYEPTLVDAYKAAVYEYSPLEDDSPRNTILKNLNEYREYTDKAKYQGADIVVFPEYGLTNIVQNPEEYAISANFTDDIIQELRTIAVERAIYLVVNVLEKEQEPNAKTKYYNTNFVFNRDGSVVLKYRKINLFQEPRLTPGDVNQNLTFTADFGVTFGIFTGVDILYENPSQTILEDRAVTDIIFPTSWISIAPFLTPLSVQHGYSVANGVNLLASNYNKPQESHGGSGIFFADGKIGESYIEETTSTKPLIRDVPVINERPSKAICPVNVPFGLPNQRNKSSILNYITKNDFAKKLYNYQSIDVTQVQSTYEACYDDFCCTFEILVNIAETIPTHVHKIVVYNGRVSYEDYDNHVSLCALVVCEDDSNDRCGARINSTTTFRRITVTGNFTGSQTYFRPISLNYYLQPIVDTGFCFQNDVNSSSFTFTTVKPQHDLLAFGVMGKVSGSSASSSIHYMGFLFVVLYAISNYILF